MDSTLAAAGLTVFAALASTLWSAGGRAALERRAMQQELDIASDLPPGRAKRQLIQIAEDRAALYVHRRVGSDHPFKFHLKMAAATTGLALVALGLASVSNLGSSFVEVVVDVLFLFAMLAVGMLAGLWITESVRDQRADMRRINVEAAKHRLIELDRLED